MARPKVTYELQMAGPIFLPNMKSRVKGALAEGVQNVGEIGADKYRGFVAGGGFVESGRFVDSIASDFKRKSDGVVGYAKVSAPDSYPKPNRPPTTFMERGTRKGVKVRKAIRGGSKTASALRKLDFSQIFGGRITKRIG